MAQGMRHLRSFRFPKMWGKLLGKLGAACTAGKDILPMLSDSVRPKMDLTMFIVTNLQKQKERCTLSKSPCTSSKHDTSSQYCVT